MENYLLDTSALFTLRDNEPGAGEVENILRMAQAHKAVVFVSFMSFMEVLYGVWRAQGQGEAYRAFFEMKMLPIKKIDSSDAILFRAGEIKATYPLSVADSWVAATAIEEEAILVHKDPEFEPLKDRLKLKTLPYKK